MENLHLEIAEFVIKIRFTKLTNLKFKKEINTILESFLITSPSNPNFEIEIDDNFTGKIDKKDNPLLVYFPKKNHKKLITVSSNTYSNFQFILQNVLYLLLSENNGFFFHASASLINNEAHLFSGQSGAGKSTIVQILSKKYPILSDDLSIIKLKGNNFFYFQHPLIEKNNIYKKTSAGYPISQINFLKKSKNGKISRRKLDTSDSIIYAEKQLRALDNKNAKTLLKLVAKCEFYNLTFPKNSKISELNW